MQDDESKVVALLLYIVWIAFWGGACLLLKHTEFAFSFEEVMVAFWVGLGFLIGYYVFHKPNHGLGEKSRQIRLLTKDDGGYWRASLDERDDYEICIAREEEEDRVPKQSKSLGIGRPRCLVLDISAFSMDGEARVWVWLETIIKPIELEGYTGKQDS
jgi:hypothetical protein